MSSVRGRILTSLAFLKTRHRLRRLKTRRDVDVWRAKRLSSFLKTAAPKVAAYADRAGLPLIDYPLTDKQGMMAHFADYNVPRISADAARAAWQAGRDIDQYSIGASTGTSGNRGFYVVSDTERFTWLGTLLAHALPDVWRARRRVAVILPANSRLYDAANESGPLTVRFFDLHEGLGEHLASISAFAPTDIVAPPKVLRALADADTALAPRQMFSGAEVLDPFDRMRIESRFGLTVREIYMATEGLFGVACPHGTLHLTEDVVAFEWLPDPSGGPLVSPVVTDFTRRSQIMLRYQMNDLLRLSEAPCPCGSPLQAVSEIVGRADDVFHLRGRHGKTVLVTPDVVRNTVLDADAGIADFRVAQTGPGEVVLTLPPGPPDNLSKAETALRGLFHRLGTDTHVTAQMETLPPPDARKLRRVVRLQEVAS